MRKFPALCPALLAVWLCTLQPVVAGATNAAPAPFDFASPKLLTGTLYAVGSHRRKILFTFRRTAIRSGDTVRVQRQYFATNGAIAAEEDITYDSGRLVSLRMREFQADVTGVLRIKPDPKDPGRQQLAIRYGHGLTPPSGDTRNLPPNTLIDDTLYPFMVDHWDELMRGDAVKFHFVSLEHERTFEFRLFKTGASIQNGRAVVQINMEPENFFVAELVKPLVFTVQADGPHRILSYIGRTTPRVKKGKTWKYLDAETVFHWPQPDAA